MAKYTNIETARALICDSVYSAPRRKRVNQKGKNCRRCAYCTV